MSDSSIGNESEAAEAAVAVTPDDDGGQGADVDTEGGEERPSGNREAAKYRRQLRDAEAQRDRSGERLAALQRGQAERSPASTWPTAPMCGAMASTWLSCSTTTATSTRRRSLSARRIARRIPLATRPATKRNPAATGQGLRTGACGGEHRPRVSWSRLLEHPARAITERCVRTRHDEYELPAPRQLE